MKKTLSIKKILSADYVSFVSWLTPLFFFIAYLFTQNKYESTATNLFYLTIGCTGIGFMLIVWRVWMLHNILDHGKLVEGQILKVFFYRARGTITYTYRYRDHQYSKKMLIQKALHNFPYQIGDTVTIVVDPENPVRSFILEFFEKSPTNS